MMEEFVMADNPRFMEGIRIQWDRCPELASSYVGRIPCIRNIDELIFHSNVVFFCGRNGTGKSTLL